MIINQTQLRHILSTENSPLHNEAISTMVKNGIIKEGVKAGKYKIWSRDYIASTFGIDRAELDKKIEELRGS